MTPEFFQMVLVGSLIVLGMWAIFKGVKLMRGRRRG